MISIIETIKHELLMIYSNRVRFLDKWNPGYFYSDSMVYFSFHDLYIVIYNSDQYAKLIHYHDVKLIEQITGFLDELLDTSKEFVIII